MARIEYLAAYLRANRSVSDEPVNEKRRSYYSEHRGELLSKVRKYRAAHREEYNAYHRKYYAEHREKLNAYYRERYARKKAEGRTV